MHSNITNVFGYFENRWNQYLHQKTINLFSLIVLIIGIKAGLADLGLSVKFRAHPLR